MCFGGGASQPVAPQVQYIGPSEADVRRNEEALATYQQQMAEQQAAFQEQLQSQIDAANADYADLEKQYASELGLAQEAADNAVTAANKVAGDNLSSAKTTAANQLQSAQSTAAGKLEGAKTAASDALGAAKTAAAGDLSSAAAAASLVQSGAYKVGTKQSDPVNAQQTKAITDKKKPKGSLKINTGGTQASAGTGLNIGV